MLITFIISILSAFSIFCCKENNFIQQNENREISLPHVNIPNYEIWIIEEQNAVVLDWEHSLHISELENSRQIDNFFFLNKKKLIMSDSPQPRFWNTETGEEIIFP